MKKTSLKMRIILFVLMFLMVVSLATAAIIPIKNAIEKSKEEEKKEQSSGDDYSDDDHDHSEDDGHNH